MPFAALAIGAGSSLLGGILGGNASAKAAKQQAQAADRATQAQLQMYHETVGREQPFVSAGTGALQQLLAELGIGPGGTGQGPLNKPFTLADFQSSPGYQFQLQQGEQAIGDAASVTGGVGGNALKELMRYGEGVANQDYWNAYNAYTQRQNQGFNQLETLAGSGQNAAANLGAIGSQVGSQIGSNIIGAGNAQAAGTMGQANAWQGGIQGILQALQGSNLNFGFGSQFSDPSQFTGPSGSSLVGGVYMDPSQGQIVVPPFG